MDINIQHIKPSGSLSTETVKGSIFRSLSLSKGTFQLSTFNFQLLFLLLLSTFTFHLSTYSQSVPFPTDHLQLWLRADSIELTDGKVSRWYDLSPNNYVIRQTGANARPTINESGKNNNPSLQFDGSSIYLTGGDILDIGTNSWTWFVIGKSNVSAWNRPYFAKSKYGTANGRYALSSNRLIYIPTSTEQSASIQSTASSWQMLTWENDRQTLNNKIYVNGTLHASSTFTNYNMQNNCSFLIGAYNGSNGNTPQTNYYLNGEIAEIIAFNTVNDSLRYAVNEYLVNKYFPDNNTQASLGLDIHVPYGFCDTAITSAYNPDFISYIWSTGETDSVIHVSQPGRYTVTVTNSFGVTSTDDISVYFPEVNKINDTTICSGDTIYWTTGLSSEDYTFQWFMDSTPLPLQSKSTLNDNPSQSHLRARLPLKALSSSTLPIHSPGSYYCIITDSLGCSFHTDTINISVDYYPISASFSRGAIPCASSDTSLCVGNTLGLATNIEETSSYIWSTGSESPRIRITDSGEYTLTSTNLRGCRATNTINVNILGEAPEIIYAIDNICFMDSTSFVGNSYSEQGIESYLWIIDETDSIAGESVNHMFATTGNHNIRTIVTSNNTCHSDSSFSITIKELPEPNFTYTPVCTGIPMTFIGNSTIPEGTSVEAYTWLINESIVGTSENLTYTFPAPIGTTGSTGTPAPTAPTASNPHTTTATLTYSLSLSNGCTSDTTIEVSAHSEYSDPRFVSPAYPSNGMFVSSDSITFLWNYDYDILYYNLITSTSADFTNADTIACTTNSISLSTSNFADTTYWKVAAYNHCLISFESESYLFRKTAGNINDVANNSNLQLWLRADSVQLTDGKVSLWYDLSPNNHMIQQTSEIARPLVKDSAINRKQSLLFDGSTSYLTGGDILDLGTNSWTWFIIGKSNVNAWNRPYFAKSIYGTANGRYSLSSNRLIYIPTSTEQSASIQSTASSWQMLTWENDRITLNNKIYVNGTLNTCSSFTNYNMQNNCSFLIGAYNGSNGNTPQTNYYLNGEIAEIIAFNTISDSLRHAVNEYLVNKYFPEFLEPSVSLGLDIHVPYGFCDTAITTAYNPDFTSYLWSTGETDSVIHVNHTGRYTVTVTNSFGVTSTDDIKVYFPEVLQMRDTTICAGDTVFWDLKLSPNDYTFQWFVDSTPLPLQSKSTLNANQPQSSLQALQPLKANQPQSHLRALLPLNAMQSNSPLRALQPLKALSSSTLPIHSPGSYYCIITDSLGCSFHTDTINISVDYYPISASFSRGAIPCASSDTSLCVGNTLGLATNIEETSSYIWSTGSESPHIRITDSGEYTLTSTNLRGCRTTNTINVNILGEAPEISYTVDNTCFKDSTSFVGNAYSEQGIESYLWIIDGTDSIATQSFNHRFATTGNHSIRTIVTSNNTCRSDSSFSINIKELPEPNFTYTPVCTGIPMTFIGNSTIPEGTSVESYTWLINDSIVGTSENLTYTFPALIGTTGSTAPTATTAPTASNPPTTTATLTYSLSLSNGCSSDTTIEVSAHSEYSEPRFVSPAYPSDDMFVSSDSISFLWNYDYDILYYNLITSQSADFSNADTITCSTNSITLPSETFADTTYWKVTAYNHCLVSLESEPYLFRKTTGGNLSVSSYPNLQLWLRADSVELIDGNVSRWYDLSTNNYVIRQTSANARPTITDSAINNNPSLQFDGSSIYLTGGDILDLGTNSWTWFVIGKSNVSAWNRPYLAKAFYGAGVNGRYSLSNTRLIYIPNDTEESTNIRSTAGSWQMLTWENDRMSLTNKIYVNGTLNASSAFTNYNMQNNCSFLIGAYNGSNGNTPQTNYYLNGEIAEIIAFNTINDSLRYAVNEYLVNKYFPEFLEPSVSLGLDIHVPYGFCDTAITTAYNPDFISYQWSTGETDSVIHVNHTGRYTVTVTNSFGVTSTDDIKVYFPEVLQMQDTIICAGDTVYWDLKLPQNDYSYQWFKDGEEYNDEYHYLPIFEGGAYNCLITDSLGCTFITDTMYLAIDNYEHTASFGNADTTLCYGNRLHIASNYEETASAIWNDGTTNLEHYLTQPGTYTVTTTNTRGCQAVNTINVNLQGQVPVANFSIEGHCQNIPINIIDLSTSEIGDISTHRWFANDSLIGTDENASHTFTDYGLQNIKLYLETTDNCANDTTISVYIDPEPRPDFLPKFFCQNALTEIHTRSSIAEGNVTAHSWIINGEPQTGDNITAMFSNNGINAITLSAESELGCVSTKTFEVNVQQADMPRIGISGICVGHETEFINETPFNNINPQTAWEWKFGDESESSTSRNAVHTYDSIGTYDISLAVTYANRCTTSIDTTITIHELPDALISTHNGCIGAETILEAEISSSDNITEYNWQIDSIFISREAQPTFVADTTGTFAVSLDIKTEYACSSQTTDSITIYENPNIMFTQSRDWGGNPLFVEFENMSNGATSYHWDFGGMGESTQPNPYFIFTAPGTYNVTLAGTSPEGCTSHYTSTAITVVEPIVDIMLMDLKANEENGFAKISLIVVNLGTLPVEDLVLELKVNNQIYRETIGHIAHGAVVPHTFGTMIPIPNSASIANSICVEALVHDVEGHSDMNLANNSLCITDAENLSVGIPYPIPASEQITCDIYTKIPTDLDISIFNIFGKLVKHEQISQHKGYMKYVVNVTDLAGGMYFIRVNSKDESITHKFEIR